MISVCKNHPLSRKSSSQSSVSCFFPQTLLRLNELLLVPPNIQTCHCISQDLQVNSVVWVSQFESMLYRWRLGNVDKVAAKQNMLRPVETSAVQWGRTAVSVWPKHHPASPTEAVSSNLINWCLNILSCECSNSKIIIQHHTQGWGQSCLNPMSYMNSLTLTLSSPTICAIISFALDVLIKESNCMSFSVQHNLLNRGVEQKLYF